MGAAGADQPGARAAVGHAAPAARRPLDGRWDFQLLPHPGAPLGEWSSIEVPGLWTMQGFAPPQYTNVQMPFDERPPNVPDDEPDGHLPAAVRAAGRASAWCCTSAAAEGALFVELNGEPVGIHKDSRTPAEFDVTELLEDDNELVCAVVQWSDASFVEDQDQWWHGGLPRDVFLYATPREHIADVFARGFADGRVRGRRAGRGPPARPGRPHRARRAGAARGSAAVVGRGAAPLHART